MNLDALAGALWLRAGRTIDKIFIAKGDVDKTLGHIASKARSAGIVVTEADRRKLDAMSQTHAHQGVIALCAVKEYSTIEDMLVIAAERGEAPFLVLCDEISDPHNLGAIIRTAECVGAHGVIIPLETEFFALRGVALLLETIDKVRDRLNPRLRTDGILATMYDGRTLHSREVLQRVREAFGEEVFATVIGRTVKFPDASVASEPITSYAPGHAGAEAYRRLAREVVARGNVA